MNNTMYEINTNDYIYDEEFIIPDIIFDGKVFQIQGGSSKIPENLKQDLKDIVLIENDFIITRHMASYYWWWNTESTNNYVDAYWRAYKTIQEMKLVDSGYPLYELKKELALISECQCLDDVRYLKRHHADDIRWHDVNWQKREYDYSRNYDRVTWSLIQKDKEGSPKREPKFSYLSGGYEFGEHYTIEETIE